jgi:hypothetical protein
MLAIVSATPDLSYDMLAPAGSQPSCLAYWIGPCDVATLRDFDAIGIARAMSYQYDGEEQATAPAWCSRRMPTGARSSLRSPGTTRPSVVAVAACH